MTEAATSIDEGATRGSSAASTGDAAAGEADAAPDEDDAAPDEGDAAPDPEGATGDRRTRRLWTLVVFAFIAVEGAGLQMRGAVLPTLGTQFGAPEWQLGLVAPAGTFGFTAVVVVVGAVAGRLDARRVLLVGFAGTGVGMALMGLAPAFPFFLGALVLRGAMTGLARGTDRPTLSHLYPTRRGRVFNFYDMAWAAGAATGPLLVAAALALGNWRLAYAALVLSLVPVVALALKLPPPDVGGGDDPLDVATLRRLLRTPEVSGMGVALFLSTGVEGGLFTWLPYYATGELRPELAGITLTVMLVTYVPGRFLAGTLAARVGYLRLLGGLVALLLPAFAFTFVYATGFWLLAGVAAIGLCVSGIYPTFIAYATDAVPEHSAPVNAVASATSAAGIGLVPAAMGFVVGGSGAGVAMRYLLVPIVALLALLGAMAVVTGPAATDTGR